MVSFSVPRGKWEVAVWWTVLEHPKVGAETHLQDKEAVLLQKLAVYVGGCTLMVDLAQLQNKKFLKMPCCLFSLVMHTQVMLAWEKQSCCPFCALRGVLGNAKALRQACPHLRIPPRWLPWALPESFWRWLEEHVVHASSPWHRIRTCCHSSLPFLHVFLQTDGRLLKTLSWDFHI